MTTAAGHTEDEIANLDKIFWMPLKTKEDLLRPTDLTDKVEELEEP